MVKNTVGNVFAAVRAGVERKAEIRKCMAIRAALQGAQKGINMLSAQQISASDRNNSLASLRGARVVIQGIKGLTDPVTPSMNVSSRVLLAYRPEDAVPSVDVFVHMSGYETLWRLVEHSEEDLVAVIKACNVSNPYAVVAFYRAYWAHLSRPKK